MCYSDFVERMIKKREGVIFMGMLWVGPWHLNPCKMSGMRFDVEKFIDDAEAGKYDGREPFCLIRQTPWYQQLKMDVGAGVYDDRRLKDEKRIFQEWLSEELRSNPHFSDRSVDHWYRMFLMSNPWIVEAMAVAGDAPAPLGFMVHSVTSSFMRHPECGWRVE